MNGAGRLANWGSAARTCCPGRGGGGVASAGGPSRAGVDGSRPKLTEALPRVAMAPGRVAACRVCV